MGWRKGEIREREKKCKQRKIEEHSSARVLFFQSIILDMATANGMQRKAIVMEFGHSRGFF